MTVFSSLYGARLDRELATDDSTVLFTTARRKAAINEGQEHFADITECLTRESTIAITGGTREYNLLSTAVLATGDFVRFSKEQVQFRYTDASSYTTVLAGDDLPRRDVEWLNRFRPGWRGSTFTSSLAQTPTAYYLRADGGNLYLGFDPTPCTGSSASADVIVPYLARPTAMTSDTHEPFTVNSTLRTDLRIYHQALVHYAAHQLEKLRGEWEKSDRQLQTFLGYVTRFLANARVKGGRVATYARDYWAVRGRDVGTDPRT